MRTLLRLLFAASLVKVSHRSETLPSVRTLLEGSRIDNRSHDAAQLRSPAAELACLLFALTSASIRGKSFWMLRKTRQTGKQENQRCSARRQ